MRPTGGGGGYLISRVVGRIPGRSLNSGHISVRGGQYKSHAICFLQPVLGYSGTESAAIASGTRAFVSPGGVSDRLVCVFPTCERTNDAVKEIWFPY